MFHKLCRKLYLVRLSNIALVPALFINSEDNKNQVLFKVTDKLQP